MRLAPVVRTREVLPIVASAKSVSASASPCTPESPEKLKVASDMTHNCHFLRW